jgi:hypothetical protein
LSFSSYLLARLMLLAVLELVLVVTAAGPLADAVALTPAFAFASHDCDEWLLELARTLGSAHPYSDDNDSTHID